MVQSKSRAFPNEESTYPILDDNHMRDSNEGKVFAACQDQKHQELENMQWS